MKKFSVLLAVLVLIAAQMACAFGEPTLSNVRTSSDDEGLTAATTFGAFDTVHVVGDLANVVAGNQISTRWYVDTVEGIEPNYFIDEIVYDVTDEPIDYVTFSLSPSVDGWPVGSYRVEIYFNGVLHSELLFSVQ